MALLIAVVYFVALIIVASMYAKKKTKSAEDFANAGGGMGWIMVTFTFVLAPLGSGHTMSLWQKAAGGGFTDWANFTGIGAGAMWWAIGAGAVFLPIAMLWIGPIYKKMRATTVPEAIERVYGKKLAWFHAGFQTMTWTGIGCSETVAIGAAIYTLCKASGIDLSIYASIIIGFVLVVCYVFFGGMLQMAWLNVINAIVMIIASYSAIAIIAVNYLAQFGGWKGVQAVYEQMGYSNILTQVSTLTQMPVWLSVIIPVIVLHTTAGAVSQTMMQPFFAAKDTSACRKGVFIGCSFNIMSSLPWIFLGMAAMAIPAIASTVSPNGLEAVPNIAAAGLPVPAIGLLMIALLAATLSTGGGIVLANANVISHDIFYKCVKPDMDDHGRLVATKVCIIIAALLLLPGALLMAHEFVFNLFLWVFSFGMPVFIVFIIGYNFKVSKSAAWITIIVSYVVDCIWTFLPMEKILHLPAGSIWGMNLYATMVVSLVLGIVLHLVLPGTQGWKKTKAAQKLAAEQDEIDRADAQAQA